MNSDPMYFGTAPLAEGAGAVSGDYVSLDGEQFYRIGNYDAMDPFFMSIVSASDHWLFIWSSGALTAGRQNSDNALFPYYTEDKLLDQGEKTGSRTILRVPRDGRRFLWEPFGRRPPSPYRLSRNLYKNVCGNKLVFEEINEDLALCFRYRWLLSERFGFAKHSELINLAEAKVDVEVLDGLENLLPWGIQEAFQLGYSSLGDAYKQSDLEAETGLATYALSSVPGDSPEPAEALRTTVCWSTAAPDATRLLSSLQLDAFRRGEALQAETRMCGRRGAYFVGQSLELASSGSRDWLIVADVDYGPVEIAALRNTLAGAGPMGTQVLENVEAGTRRLYEIVARADGLQSSADRLGAAHHFSNVLFNVMRGGVFEGAYRIDVDDLSRYLQAFNRDVYARHQTLLDGLGETVSRRELLDRLRAAEDPDLLRLVTEYLPISFSRRHGDPSRPWNKFSINIKNPDGSRLLDYQGNWRDIFQNWEALCLSFPDFFESVISKFLNCSTADGYNPYRVTRAGYDWEIPDPDEPWAHFGYWGDHQLIYLLKLLEWSRAFHPGALEALLDERRFVYADVPYDIKSYAELLADPRDSLIYNRDREGRIAERVAALGNDGRCLASGASLCRANFAEKLLVPLLAKLANFVAGGGFWMNTQRPEWNDANNALAGLGVSMVTLYYARRYVAFCQDLLSGSGAETITLNTEVALWLRDTHAALIQQRPIIEADVIAESDRKALLDALAGGAEAYRGSLYDQGLGGQSEALSTRELGEFFSLTLAYFDQTIRLNRRDDGLYHAYNVLDLSPSGIGIKQLTVMLEGQVSALSSGALDAAEALAVTRALRQSPLYRSDQHSYLLYPDRSLPAFLEKNRIPEAQAEGSALLPRLLADGDRSLIEQDGDGALYFNSRFRNVRDLEAALEALSANGYADLVARECELIAALFEAVFNHQSFTGRSGTFYGYEGLGCIYWHQVSKLLLAVQEACFAAADSPEFDALAASYYDLRAGIGFNKSPEIYGAFPTDPYSHTPGFAGARQPGMTGQVKEEIITRLGELGLFVRDGRLRFDPRLLRRSEFLQAEEHFAYYDVNGQPQRLTLEAGTLAFTFCQLPVMYRLSDRPALTLHWGDGERRRLEGLLLDRASSAEIFARSGKLTRLEVELEPGLATSAVD